MRFSVKQLSVGLWVFILGAAILQAAEKPRLVDPAQSPAGPELEIKTEKGTCYVRLGGQSDGPVRIPIDNGLYSAVLLSTRLSAEKVNVTLSGEEDKFTTGTLGEYELSLGDDPVRLATEVKAGGAGTWEMRVVQRQAAACSGGCQCGRICCIPAEGQCIGCSDCGTCCG
jgi:hypothetical protein